MKNAENAKATFSAIELDVINQVHTENPTKCVSSDIRTVAGGGGGDGITVDNIYGATLRPSLPRLTVPPPMSRTVC